jgi:citrate lyase subunit beta / citryl-CoA lyase
MPGSNAKALAKARGLPADGLILDLEDAVAPAAKGDARALVVAAVATGGYGRREVVVRINGPDTPWYADDVAAVGALAAEAARHTPGQQAQLSAVLLPKVESPRQLDDLRARLAAAGAPPSLPLWAMIETPRGVLRAAEIAAAGGGSGGGGGRVACLVAGTSDLTKDLRARHTDDRAPLLHALAAIVLAARAAPAPCGVLDGVQLDLTDADGFASACRQGRELGFDGKTLIHPGQVAAANAAFAPSAAEVDAARRILAAHAAATAAGSGVVVVDGRLVEGLHVAEAADTVALAEAVAAMAAL